MNSDNPRGVIELGNLSLKCIIFKIKNDNSFEVLSTSVTASEGIHNGSIINLKKASDVIRFCISDAEKKANVELKKINVIVEQPEFLCTKFSKHRKIDGSKIDKDDIEFLLKEAKKEVTINDKNHSIIHIFNHNYIVDGKTFIEEPINVYADFMSHEMTFITMPKNNLRNIKEAFIDCDIEVERFFSNIFTLGAKLLNDNQLKFGTIIIDLGFEKTSMGYFKNFALVHSSTFPIGINHISKDISKVCSLNLDESEIIKNKTDFSFDDNNLLFDDNENLKKDYFNNSNFRKISKNMIFDVMEARLEEILKKVKKEIISSGANLDSGISFFVIGGGSNLTNLDKYCSNFFSTEVKKIGKNNLYQNQKIFEDKFDSCFGALKIIREGWETEAIPEPVNNNSQKTSFFAKIFG